ncbi:MAG: hypothetical protein NTU97_01360 [Candidatus Magasanikbacteria bacterium]|nr:hypothetical protein [Candidatus Magasanikbacteria bacterium]
MDEALEAGAKHGIIVVPGAEFTPYDKMTFPHILALGLDPDRVRGKKLPFFRDIEETAGWIHENDGLVVAPHPSCAGLRMKIIPASLSSLTLEKNIALFDAIQTHDIEIGFNYTADKIAKKHHKPCIGGSDFHLSEQVGIVRTRLLYDVSTWQEVVEAIRRGQVEPFFSENRTWEELQAFSRAVLVKKRMKQLFGK